jgi:hypothetical protein
MTDFKLVLCFSGACSRQYVHGGLEASPKKVTVDAHRRQQQLFAMAGCSVCIKFLSSPLCLVTVDNNVFKSQPLQIAKRWRQAVSFADS